MYGQSFAPTLTTLNAVVVTLGVSTSAQEEAIRGPSSPDAVGTSDTTFSATVQISLYTGSGFNGTLVASTTVDVTSADPTAVEFDFAAPVTLTPLSVYTFSLSLAGATNSQGETYLQVADATNNPYAGGSEYSFLGQQGGSDLTFAEGTAAPAGVPEPSTWALLGVGVAGLGVVTLRRRSSAARV